MVIAQGEGGRYAFFRGTRDLGPPKQTPNAPATEASGAKPQSKSGKEGLLDDLKDNNEQLQMEQQKQLDRYYKNPIQGGFGGGGFF
jgi:hypothetical protein